MSGPGRRAGRVLGALLVSWAVGGCSTLETGNDRINPEEPMWFHHAAGSLRVLFTRALTAPSRTTGEASERGRPEIDPGRGRVFVGSSDGGLYALRAVNGSSLWRFETAGAVQSEPLYDPELDIVYFGSNDGALYAVHASDGSLVWRYDSGAEVARKPVRVGETLYVANAADNLFAIDRRTAKTLWHVHRTPALGMEVSGYAGPAYAHETVFFAFSDGHVGAYDARTGSERWSPVDLSAEAEQSAGPDAVRYLDVDTTPAVDDLGAQGRLVFVASYAGGVFALDQERGTTAWRNDRATGVTDVTLWREPAHPAHPGTADFVADGPAVPRRELLIASSSSTGMWALDPSNGRAVWRVPIPEGGITAPAAIAGALLVGTSHYGIFLLSPVDGRPIDGFDRGTGFAQTPAAFGARAFALSNAGTLLALHVDPPGPPNASSSADSPWR